MLKIVQERPGHADPATTARIYLHVIEQASDKARSEQEMRIAAAIALAARTAETSNLSATWAVRVPWGSRKPLQTTNSGPIAQLVRAADS